MSAPVWQRAVDASPDPNVSPFTVNADANAIPPQPTVAERQTDGQCPLAQLMYFGSPFRSPEPEKERRFRLCSPPG